MSGDKTDEVETSLIHVTESEIKERTDELLLASAEVDYQEELIRDRSQGISNIQRDVNTINRLFQDVSAHVSHQGDMLEHIETNVTNARDQTQRATHELATASRRSPSGRRTCLQLLVVLFLVLVALALLRSLLRPSVSVVDLEFS
jgi:t-SNARE complex subunit (syntaxin)